MEIELPDLREFLTAEFMKRKSFKPQYSKRAYSRDLGLPATCLNGFLAGKRELSLKNINKVFKYLKKKTSICCSWCGKAKRKSRILIGGPRSQFICYECVEECNHIINTGRLMTY